MNKNYQKTLANTAAAHRNNLLRRLQHRLEVARSKNDATLIRQLEAEAKYLGTSL
jgi:hypothetical protein